MKYKINELVVIEKCKSVKCISDSEVIQDVVIYYMSDNTSYSESQILTTKKGFKKIKKLTSSSKIDDFINILDNGKMVRGYEKLFLIYPKEEKKEIKNKKWFSL
jgi:hypothetical protein